MMKSFVAPMMGAPYLGERIWSCTCIRSRASVWASLLWGMWRFISSPSKSAL